MIYAQTIYESRDAFECPWKFESDEALDEQSSSILVWEDGLYSFLPDKNGRCIIVKSDGRGRMAPTPYWRNVKEHEEVPTRNVLWGSFNNQERYEWPIAATCVAEPQRWYRYGDGNNPRARNELPKLPTGTVYGPAGHTLQSNEFLKFFEDC